MCQKCKTPAGSTDCSCFNDKPSTREYSFNTGEGGGTTPQPVEIKLGQGLFMDEQNRINLGTSPDNTQGIIPFGTHITAYNPNYMTGESRGDLVIYPDVVSSTVHNSDVDSEVRSLVTSSTFDVSIYKISESEVTPNVQLTLRRDGAIFKAPFVGYSANPIGTSTFTDLSFATKEYADNSSKVGEGLYKDEEGKIRLGLNPLSQEQEGLIREGAYLVARSEDGLNTSSVEITPNSTAIGVVAGSDTSAISVGATNVSSTSGRSSLTVDKDTITAITPQINVESSTVTFALRDFAANNNTLSLGANQNYLELLSFSAGFQQMFSFGSGAAKFMIVDQTSGGGSEVSFDPKGTTFTGVAKYSQDPIGTSSFEDNSFATKKYAESLGFLDPIGNRADLYLNPKTAPKLINQDNNYIMTVELSQEDLTQITSPNISIELEFAGNIKGNVKFETYNESSNSQNNKFVQSDLVQLQGDFVEIINGPIKPTYKFGVVGGKTYLVVIMPAVWGSNVHRLNTIVSIGRVASNTNYLATSGVPNTELTTEEKQRLLINFIQTSDPNFATYSNLPIVNNVYYKGDKGVGVSVNGQSADSNGNIALSKILNTRTNTSLEFWSGTAAEYNAIAVKNANVIYLIEEA